jgi:hypothetical protein
MTINDKQRVVIVNSLGPKLRELGIIGGMSISEIGGQNKLYISLNTRLSTEEEEKVKTVISSSGEFDSIDGVVIHYF